MANFKPYPRKDINGLLWRSPIFILVGLIGIFNHAGEGNPIRLALYSLLTAYFVVTLIRTIWYCRQYAIADEQNRRHGR